MKPERLTEKNKQTKNKQKQNKKTVNRRKVYTAVFILPLPDVRKLTFFIHNIFTSQWVFSSAFIRGGLFCFTSEFDCMFSLGIS